MGVFLAALAASLHLLAARPPRCTPEGCFVLATVALKGAGGPANAAPPPPPPASQFVFPDGQDLILVAATSS